jgi:hypothetical protein
VPVLITSCQVSLKPNSGPVTSQTRIVNAANTEANGWQLVSAVHLAKSENGERGVWIRDVFRARSWTWLDQSCGHLHLVRFGSASAERRQRAIRAVACAQERVSSPRIKPKKPWRTASLSSCSGPTPVKGP